MEDAASRATDALATVAAAVEDGRLTDTRLADGTAIVLNIENFRVCTLNSTAVEILAAIRGGARTPEEIATRLIREFSVDFETALADSRKFLVDLASRLVR